MHYLPKDLRVGDFTLDIVLDLAFREDRESIVTASLLTLASLVITNSRLYRVIYLSTTVKACITMRRSV